MRKDLHPFRHRDKTTVDLRTLCARRTDLASDRNRAINRLRAQLLEYFPALERAFDFAHRKAALILLTGYQTPTRCAGSAQRVSRNGYAIATLTTPAILRTAQSRPPTHNGRLLSDRTSPPLWSLVWREMYSILTTSLPTLMP
jgi:Transposase